MTLPVRNNERGFTLIELLVVMLVLGILSVTITNFISLWLQTSSIAETRATLLNTAQTALSEVSNDIILSGSVDQVNRWPDPNGPGGAYGWQANSQTLILAKVAVDSGGNAIFLDTSNYITQKDDEIYFLSGTTLYRRTLASNSVNDAAITTCPLSDSTSTCPPDKVIATGVTYWSVAYYDANDQLVSPGNARAIQLSISLTAPYGNQTINASYTTRMVFRND